MKFNKNSFKELKEHIYSSCIHDAVVQSIEYNQNEKILIIDAENSFFNTKFRIIFSDIECLLSIKGRQFGNDESIISLTAEDDFSYLYNYLNSHVEFDENNVYILIQMLSGSELHILSQEVEISIEKI